MSVPTVSVTDFAYRCNASRDADDGAWMKGAMRGLATEVGIPARFEVYGGFGSAALEMPAKLVVGISVSGFKKTPRGKEIVVDYAAFDAKTGKIVAWSPSLSVEANYRRPTSFSLSDPKKPERYELDAATIAALKTKRGPVAVAPPPASTTAPFSHDKDLFAVASSPDDSLIASSGFDGRLAIWRAATGERIANAHLAKGMAFLHEIAFAPDGKLLAVGPRKITLYALPGATAVRTLDGHPRGEVQGIAFSPSGKLLASTSGVPVKGADNSAAVWDVKTGKLVRRWKLPDAQGLQIAFLDEATLIVLTERNDALFRIAIARDEIAAEHRFGSFVDAERSLAITSAGIIVNIGRKFLCCDRKTLAPTPLAFGKIEPGVFALSRDGKRLAIGQTDGIAIVAPSAPKQVKRLATDGSPQCVAWTSGAILAGIGTRVVRVDV